MITRSTLYTVKGGDTVQVLQTAKHLTKAGVDVSVHLADETIDYGLYDILHFFNITRPADIWYHIRRSKKPYVVSPIFIDYSEYDKRHRKGMSGWVLRYFSQDGIEYVKTVMRWLSGRDKLITVSYLWQGQRKLIDKIISNASLILPNSQSEAERIHKRYGCSDKCRVIPNGIDASLFRNHTPLEKNPQLVICVARIEGIKNQLNLIRGLNDSRFSLLLIGACSPGQQAYYQKCRRIAASNVQFIDALPQQELLAYYRQAKVHVLPSWFETTGLSSLEAAAMGCQIVITDRGDAQQYFGDYAFYCDPASPASIYDAIDRAANAPVNPALAQWIHDQYTWTEATGQTIQAYQELI